MPIYKDLNLSFDSHAATGDLVVVTDDQAIKQSVKNIVLTSFYERPNRPDFGCAGKKLLFEQNDVFTRMTIAATLITALENYEPRIEVETAYVDESAGGNALDINIVYTILSYRKKESINLVINRVR